MTGDASGGEEIWSNQEIYRNSQISYSKITPKATGSQEVRGFKSHRLNRLQFGLCRAFTPMALDRRLETSGVTRVDPHQTWHWSGVGCLRHDGSFVAV
jgi:hypothetical protein